MQKFAKVTRDGVSNVLPRVLFAVTLHISKSLQIALANNPGNFRNKILS